MMQFVFRYKFHVVIIQSHSSAAMSLGRFDETVGCRGPVDVLGPAAQKHKSRVVVSRSPKRLKGQQLHFKVRSGIQHVQQVRQ